MNVMIPEKNLSIYQKFFRENNNQMWSEKSGNFFFLKTILIMPNQGIKLVLCSIKNSVTLIYQSLKIDII